MRLRCARLFVFYVYGGNAVCTHTVHGYTSVTIWCCYFSVCGRETHVLTCTFSTWFAHARTHYFRILIVHESIYLRYAIQNDEWCEFLVFLFFTGKKAYGRCDDDGAPLCRKLYFNFSCVTL